MFPFTWKASFYSPLRFNRQIVNIYYRRKILFSFHAIFENSRLALKKLIPNKSDQL